MVDSSQGVEAQTVANVYLALDNDLEIFTVLNKIDLAGSEPDRVKQEIDDVLGLDASDAILASAKANIGMDDILERIVEVVPPPRETADEPFRALIFDSYFDPYRGVVAVFRVMDGVVKTGDAMQMMATGAKFAADEIGIMRPDKVPVKELGPGEVGYIIGGIKSVADARVGDTITSAKTPATEALRVTRNPCRWFSRASSPRTPTDTTICASLSDVCKSTMRRWCSNRNKVAPWVRVSVADSSVCCTWKLFKSVSNVSTT